MVNLCDSKGCTFHVPFSSHQLTEVCELCEDSCGSGDRPLVTIDQHGRIHVGVGDPGSLVSKFNKHPKQVEAGTAALQAATELNPQPLRPQHNREGPRAGRHLQVRDQGGMTRDCRMSSRILENRAKVAQQASS